MLQDVNNGDCNEDGTVRDSRFLQRYFSTFEVIWNIVLCCWANGPLGFEGLETIKTKVMRSFETSGTIGLVTRRHIP